MLQNSNHNTFIYLYYKLWEYPHKIYLFIPNIIVTTLLYLLYSFFYYLKGQFF